MTKTITAITLTLLFIPICSWADKVKLETKGQRQQMLRKASVWQPQKHLSVEDILHGPKAKGYAKLFNSDTVYCLTNQEDQNEFKTGHTPKFYCQLLEPNEETRRLMPVTKKSGKRRVIKVKYHQSYKENREIQGEILGTRLLWALGFYADQMFYVPKLHCYGCEDDPFKNRRVNYERMQKPKVFYGVAIERQLDGDKIESKKILHLRQGMGHEAQWIKKTIWDDGLKFSEMMDFLPAKKQNPKAWRQQLAQRDALRLLSVFMNHIDVKAPNQRFVCLKGTEEDRCDKPIMMIQDIGTSFGVRTNVSKVTFDKVQLKLWKRTPIWLNAEKCEMNFTNDVLINFFMADRSMQNSQVSNSGRIFLAQLLQNFAKDKSRVQALFQAAHVNPSEIDAWVNTFLEKVEQVSFPMGREWPDFQCPLSPYEKR